MKASELDRRPEEGKDVTGALDLSKARGPAQEQRRVNADFPSRTIQPLDRQSSMGYPSIDYQGPDRRETRTEGLVGIVVSIIGKKRGESGRMALVHARFGGTRKIDMLVGDPLPRICQVSTLAARYGSAQDGRAKIVDAA